MELNDDTKQILAETKAGLFVLELSRFIEELLRGAAYSLSKKLLISYSATLILFLINFSPLSEIAGEGAVLWTLFLTFIAIVWESIIFAQIYSKLRIGKIIESLFETFEKHHEEVPESHRIEFYDSILARFERAEFIKEIIRGLRSNVKLENQNHISGHSLTYKSEIMAKFMHFKEMKEKDGLYESKEKESSRIVEFLKSFGKSLLSIIFYSFGVTLFIFNILLAKYPVMLSWFLK